jgi:energy-coupling factor transporter ATP-binding protein EcfA2
MPGLRFRRAAFSYGRKQVLQDVSIDVPAGAFTAVLGANGSGKSSLLRLAAGLRRPQAGQVELGEGTPAHAAAQRGLDVVHGGKHRGPFAGHGAQVLQHFLAAVGVQARDRLVGHDDLRALHEEAAQGHALALAAGEVPDALLGVRGQAHAGQGCVHLAQQAAGRHAEQGPPGRLAPQAAMRRVLAGGGVAHEAEVLRWADGIIVVRDGTATGPKPAGEVREEDVLCGAR